jgi:hypothetical protein
MRVVLHRHDGEGIAWQVYEPGSESDVWLNGPLDPDLDWRRELLDQMRQWNNRVAAFEPSITCACGRVYHAESGSIRSEGAE